MLTSPSADISFDLEDTPPPSVLTGGAAGVNEAEAITMVPAHNNKLQPVYRQGDALRYSSS